MYNPAAYNYNYPNTFPTDQNFNIMYAHPNQMAPNYAGYEDPMYRDQRQEFTGNHEQYPMKNPSNMQGDFQYNQSFQGRNYAYNERPDNFQGQRYRQNDSYYNNDYRNDLPQGTVLPESKRIFKPGMKNPRRQGRPERNERYERQDRPERRDRYDSRSYGDRSPLANRNFSKPGPRRQEVIPNDKIDHKALNPAMFYKTKMCPQYMEKGSCPRGEGCCYAHSQNELRDVPNLKKTKLCHLFQIGKCNRGNTCSFAHGEQELRSTPEFYKTSICNGYLKGSCRAGENCRYAHGKEELRALVETQTTLPQDDGYNPSGFAFTPYPSLPSFDGNVAQQQHQPDDWNISGPNAEANQNFNQPGPFYYSDPNYMHYYQAPTNPEPELQKDVPNETHAENNSTEKEPETTEKDEPVEDPAVPQEGDLHKDAEETPNP